MQMKSVDIILGGVVHLEGERDNSKASGKKKLKMTMRLRMENSGLYIWGK